MKIPIAFWMSLMISLVGCSGAEDEGPYVEGDAYQQQYGGEQGYSQGQGSSRNVPSGGTASAGQRVTVVDRGLNMPMAVVTFPAGWRFFHDVATNMNTAAYDRFLIDIQSPDGMLIRGLGSAQYIHSGGSNFNSLVERMAMAGAQGIEGLRYGEFVPNQRVMAQPRFQRAMQRAQSMGSKQQALHLSFTGTAQGRPVEGRLQVDHTLFLERGQHFGGVVNVVLLISAPGQIETLVKLSDAIDQGIQSNPAYDQARSRVIDAVTARNTVAHKKRMAQNQAQFESHQAMMKGRYQSAYAQNDRWLQNFRNSGGSSGSGSGYSGHDKFIDMIGETTSFNDPNTGTQMRQDGQFDRWATDGQGNYVGSDNPSFDPNAMGGNWQEARPLE
ncbi:MAG: hypothetical protein GY946_01835 [bacterium]|nr:hypothetical protein [bacterium]